MGWIDKLKQRWGIDSTKRIWLILLVFACTGTTIVLIKKPIFIAMGFDPANLPLWFAILYYILILPIYMLFLLIYGYIFGQFSFFKGFVSKSLSRFKRKKAKMDQ